MINIMNGKDIFELTEDHLKLAKRMHVGWKNYSHSGSGSPEIDPKRPYGNSDVFNDVGEILGIKSEGKNGEFSENQIRQIKKIHKEMETVIQIGLVTLKFEPGFYIKKNSYSATSWIKLDEDASEVVKMLKLSNK
jgi:hypothetical protein